MIGAGARVAVLVLVGLLVVMVRGGSITDTRAEGPPRLVFTSNRAPDYASEVYSLDVARGTHRSVSRDVHADQLLAVRQGEVLFSSERRGKALYAARLGSRRPARRLSELPEGATADGASWARGGELAVALTRGGSPLVELLGRSGRRIALFANTGPVPPDDALLLPTQPLLPSMWSADGRLLALHDFGIRLVDSSGRQRLRLNGDQALWADASPRLAVNTGDPYSDEPGANSTVIYDEHGRTIRTFAGRTLALSPDGRTVVLARTRGSTWLASVDSGKLRRLASGSTPAIFSPNSEHVELNTDHEVDGSAQAVVVSASSGRVEARLDTFGVWLPDSRRLAFADPHHPNRATIVTIDGRILDRPLLAPPGDELANLSAVPGMDALVYTAAQSDAVDQLYERLESGRLHQITRGFTAHSEPAPSPDGRLIADTEWGTPCGNCIPSDIGVLLMARPRRGRALPNARGENRVHPSWSPNSKRLVYAVLDDDYQGLIVANADGSHRVALAQGLGHSWPAWSPDGSAIAATGTRFGALFVITRDGERSRRLATGLEGPPAWSPDGRMIAFGRADGLYVIQRDGRGLHRILTMRRVDSVAWAPDASRIAFSAAGCQRRPQECQLRTSDIWTVRPDGRDLRRITTNIANDWWPAWLPAH